MLTREQIASLPDDAEDAFATGQAMLYEWRKTHEDETFNAELTYIKNLRSLADILQIDIIDDLPVKQHYDNMRDYITEFDLSVSDFVFRMLLTKARRSKNIPIGSIEVVNSARDKIITYLNEMTKLVNQLDIPDPKRERIASLISSLLREIMTGRTKYESWMELAIEISKTTGQVAENLNPLRKLLDKAFSRLGDAKQNTEALPRSETQKRLEPPEIDADEADPDVSEN